MDIEKIKKAITKKLRPELVFKLQDDGTYKFMWFLTPEIVSGKINLDHASKEQVDYALKLSEASDFMIASNIGCKMYKLEYNKHGDLVARYTKEYRKLFTEYALKILAEDEKHNYKYY